MEANGPTQESPGFGVLLRRCRLAAGLSQEALAERARMSVEGISALERGFRRAPYRETLGLLAGALALDDEQRRALEEAAENARSPRRRGAASVTLGPWAASRAAILPRALTTFVGRDEELIALDAALAQHKIVAVYGLGGVGKSSLAREYAWRNRDQYPVVWWLGAQTEDSIIDDLICLGATFAHDLVQLADRRAAARRVINSVLGGFDKSSLLIFDNLEDEGYLRNWLPSRGARALVTSRVAAWGADVAAIPLRTWPLETAADYLRRETGRSDLSDTDARAIADALGTLPLALAHAAGALRDMRMLTPDRYLDHISEHLKKAPRGAEYPQSVFAAFNAAIAHAEQDAPGAAAALCFAASFAPDAIPDELFRQPVESYVEGLRPTIPDVATLDLRSVIGDEVRLDEALGTLDRLSLLVFSESSRTYRMHRLVQLGARDLTRGATPAWSECAVEVVDAAFPYAEVDMWTQRPDVAMWPQCARLLPHARAALDALPSDMTTFLPAGRLADRCAVYLCDRGAYEVAEPLQARALAIRKSTLGTDDRDTTSSAGNLARVYLLQGRYEEAEQLLAHALETLEKTLGPDRVDVAICLNRLAVARCAQGYQESEQLFIRALAILENQLGPAHRLVADTLNNLAHVRYQQRNYDETKSMLMRSLAIREKEFGLDHPVVAESLSNLSNLHREQGSHEEAEQLCRRALNIQARSLGHDHPYIAQNLNGLAEIYCDQQRYEAAEVHAERALAIAETLGLDNPIVADSLYFLANALQGQARYCEAQELFTRALAIFEKILPPDHPKVKSVRDRLGPAKN